MDFQKRAQEAQGALMADEVQSGAQEGIQAVQAALDRAEQAQHAPSDTTDGIAQAAQALARSRMGVSTPTEPEPVADGAAIEHGSDALNAKAGMAELERQREAQAEAPPQPDLGEFAVATIERLFDKELLDVCRQLSDVTLKQYAEAWLHFESYSRASGFTAAPATPARVALYLAQDLDRYARVA
jgi:hypothetical protein